MTAGRLQRGSCLGVVIALLMSIGPMASASTSHSEGHPDEVVFRPVLCIAPPYDPSVQPAAGRSSSSSCTPESLLNTTNLRVTPSTNADGYTINTVPLDSKLVGTPSTKPSSDIESATVLLPGLGTSGSKDRYLLGPGEITGSSIGRARVQYQQFNKTWVVNLTMTKRGTVLWNKFARAEFHKEVAVVVGGVVVSYPLIQPSQYAFTSFGPYATVAGPGIGHAEALRIARTMTKG